MTNQLLGFYAAHSSLLLSALAALLAAASSVVFGAVTVTNIFAGVTGGTRKVVDITATADADTQAVIPHSLGAVPANVYLTPEDPVARIALWVVTSITTTQVVVGKATTAGSSAATPQLRVDIQLPHSLTQ